MATLRTNLPLLAFSAVNSHHGESVLKTWTVNSLFFSLNCVHLSAIQICAAQAQPCRRTEREKMKQTRLRLYLSERSSNKLNLKTISKCLKAHFNLRRQNCKNKFIRARKNSRTLISYFFKDQANCSFTFQKIASNKNHKSVLFHS